MDTRAKPFDSFSNIYKILTWLGFYEPLNEINCYAKILHKLFRILVLIAIFIYNLMNIGFIIEPSNDTALRIEALMIEIPQINLFSKALTIALYRSRINKINTLLNDPIFSSSGAEDEKYLLRNIKEADRLFKVINTFVTVSGACWSTSSIVQTIRDKSTVIPIYIPFISDAYWAKFLIIFLAKVVTLPWIGYGHIILDWLVATYFSQAQVQLQIIKYNLEHLFDKKDEKKNDGLNRETIDEEEYAKLVYYIKRYEKLVWYIKEVNRVFDPLITIQFLTSSATMCMVIYQLSQTDVLSFKFLFLTTLFLLLQMQVFFYCFYGNMVRHESESVCTAVYSSAWPSSSARARRTMLVAMARWSRPLTTKVAGIVPLALDTFLDIIRFSYTLYTMLSARPRDM